MPKIPSQRVNTLVSEIIEDMELRVDADIQEAYSVTRFGTTLSHVNRTVREVHDRMIDYSYDATDEISELLGPVASLVLVATQKNCLLDDIDSLIEGLRQVSLYGGPRNPYSPIFNNPYTRVPRDVSQPAAPRPAPAPAASQHQRRDSILYIAPRKAKPAITAEPELVPGEGSGPKPSPAKTKVKGTAEWEGQGWPNTTWGDSENWEELAMHVAYKEKLAIKAKIKADEEEEAKNAAVQMPVKGGKAAAVNKGKK